ncbi:carbohydrate ABC transporter permease [Paenibacillus flagellatus]|uniref:Sugar ABC transporter permease n=1 Tax=Paenibacillus flagellatus TaxID=2211139 RepID=A0A2V5KB33_9BACL|nr:sugar ABC transporter permease [Paenibacillus flagellatus]PYI55123.1 sugar ABC transporter permease [Paenibacillus flagellatus]
MFAFRRRKKSRPYIREGWVAALFLTPSLAGFAIFFLIPFGVGFTYSLLDTPVGGSFVGARNYVELFGNASFRRAAVNTMLFTAVSVPLNMALSLALAMLLNRSVYLRSWFRIGFLAPLVIPVASVVLVWQTLFDLNGSLNGWLASRGFAPKDWMESGTAFGVVVLVYLWKNVGYNMVLFLAGLQNIPADYYEAASIDGAGPFRKWRTVTIVYLTPTAFFVFIMSIVNSFKVFRETYMIAGDYPQERIYMLQHFMNNMFQSLDYPKLTGAAFLMAVVVVALVFALFRIERRISDSLG